MSEKSDTVWAVCNKNGAVSILEARTKHDGDLPQVHMTYAAFIPPGSSSAVLMRVPLQGTTHPEGGWWKTPEEAVTAWRKRQLAKLEERYTLLEKLLDTIAEDKDVGKDT